MDAAIDAADAAFVEKTRGYVAILLARANQMPAYAAFLRNARLTTAPRAIFKRPRALYVQIVDITASVQTHARRRVPLQTRKSSANSTGLAIQKGSRASTANTATRSIGFLRPAKTTPNAHAND